jgi:hypothetical protein
MVERFSFRLPIVKERVECEQGRVAIGHSSNLFCALATQALQHLGYSLIAEDVGSVFAAKDLLSKHETDWCWRNWSQSPESRRAVLAHVPRLEPCPSTNCAPSAPIAETLLKRQRKGLASQPLSTIILIRSRIPASTILIDERSAPEGWGMVLVA